MFFQCSLCCGQAVKQRVAQGDSLTLVALDALKTSPPVNGDHGYNWAVNEIISRGISGQDNYMNAYRNAARAYQCALLWKITGEDRYGDIAIDVLNAYRTYNKGLGGNTNISLIPGFIGYQFVNAAEIMRDDNQRSTEDFELFKQYMVDVWFTVAQDFLERRHDTVERERNWYHYYSNWGLGNALFCVSLGVLCDLPDIYNYGMYWLKEGPGNESLCVTALHPDAFGQGLCGYGWGLIPWFHADKRGPLGDLNQMQESGRDQGHAMAALGLLSYAFESAYNQGDNAFCNLNNQLIPGKAGSMMVAGAAEYLAAYNAGHDDLPSKTNWWMTGLSVTGRGQWRPIWQLFINHYQNRMGVPMAYCSEMKSLVGLERGGGSYGNNSGGYDHTGFGDLMYDDTPVKEDQVPTVLYPSIASSTSTRKYAEIRDVEPGTVLTLSASLPDGEKDTGQWKWEDGVGGSQRQITADHSGLYRLTYTNGNGVVSEGVS
ncbi:MAG: alginate lyase family protein [Paraprevotella sp.]|nr:alginate lyase family protein [Paraprevotella sp.]